MPSFKNVSSYGDLELPVVGRVIAAGEVFEVTDVVAELLSMQPDVWAFVSEKGKK